MPPFRVREDAKIWFRDLRDKEAAWSLDFDAFYFCFMAGIARRQKKKVSDSETAELVDYFPGKYGPKGKLLVAVFLTRELEKYGLGMNSNNKRDVHSAISKFVSPDARNYLSDLGVREFNAYAHGGLDVLREEWFDDRPRSLDTFVRLYKRKIDEMMAGAV